MVSDKSILTLSVSVMQAETRQVHTHMHSRVLPRNFSSQSGRPARSGGGSRSVTNIPLYEV